MNTRRIAFRSIAPAAFVLVGVAVGLVVSPMLAPSTALAQDSPKSGEPPWNATAERKAMISQLTEINSRLGRIEDRLKSGLAVKVTEMPASSRDSDK